MSEPDFAAARAALEASIRDVFVGLDWEHQQDVDEWMGRFAAKSDREVERTLQMAVGATLPRKSVSSANALENEKGPPTGFGQLLKSRLARIGWSQATLVSEAEIADDQGRYARRGITPSSVSDWVRGVRVPTMKVLRRVADLMGLTPSQTMALVDLACDWKHQSGEYPAWTAVFYNDEAPDEERFEKWCRFVAALHRIDSSLKSIPPPLPPPTPPS